jgi:hypothetical protein
MLKGTLKIIGFFLLVIALAYGTDVAITTGFKRVNTSQMGAFNRAMQGRVNADIVISGSSRAYVHYDPRIIREITGRSTFNLARDGSHTDVQLAALKAYLQSNRKPSLVIQNLDMHSLVLTARDEILNPFQYVPYLANDAIYSGLHAISPEVWKWKHIPLYGYVVEDVNFGWTLGLKSFFGRQPPEDHIDGYLPADRTWNSDFARFKAANPNGVGFAVGSAGVAKLQELIALCQSQGIKLKLVYSPQYVEMLDLVTNKTQIFAEYRKLAQANKVEFLDFTTEPYCADRDYFYNSQHLNKRGAERFSRDLATRLTSDKSANTSMTLTAEHGANSQTVTSQ